MIEHDFSEFGSALGLVLALGWVEYTELHVTLGGKLRPSISS